MFHTGRPIIGSTIQNTVNTVYAGYQASDPMIYQLTLPKDHPDGERPVEIFDKSRGLHKFEKALKIMENETTVLILMDLYFSDEFSDIIANKLPNGSYIQHHRHRQDNRGASEFVKNQLSKTTKPSKKFLICDWPSAAGYESTAVIFVTEDKCGYSNSEINGYATNCLRAKAKLVIYTAPRGM